MKKKIIGIIALGIILLGVWLLIRPKAFGNMNQVCTEPTTSSSTISFSGEAGDKLKFSFRSDIENGALDIILYDSKGNVVHELDKAKELETYFTLEESDTYTLAAEYSDFVGNYKIVVYKAN